MTRSFKYLTFVSAAALSFTSPAEAVLHYLDSSWSGDGTDEGNQSAGTFPSSVTRVTGFDSGTLTISPSSLLQSRFQTPTGVSVNFTVNGGGSADLIQSNRTGNDNGSMRFDGLQVGNFSGAITSLGITVSYTNPIAARADVFTPGRVNAGPLGSALGLVSGSTGDFDVTTSYGGIFTATSATSPITPGTPVGDVTASALFGSVAGGATSFSSPNGFSGLIDQNLDPDFLVIDGYDTDGSGNRGIEDAPLTYITTQTWTITPDSAGSGFTSGTLFTLSLDGRQFENVPEPSTTLISFIGLTSLLLRRRR